MDVDATLHTDHKKWQWKQTWKKSTKDLLLNSPENSEVLPFRVEEQQMRVSPIFRTS